jgi:hypothetical protein
MNKTAIVQTPLKWGAGFHFCSQPPRFDDLYLIHLKHAAMGQLTAFGDFMRDRAEGNSEVEDYFDFNRERLLAHRQEAFGLRRVSSADAMVRNEFLERYQASIERDETGLYSGPHIYDDVIVEIPEAFVGLI